MISFTIKKKNDRQECNFLSSYHRYIMKRIEVLYVFLITAGLEIPCNTNIIKAIVTFLDAFDTDNTMSCGYRYASHWCCKKMV